MSTIRFGVGWTDLRGLSGLELENVYKDYKDGMAIIESSCSKALWPGLKAYWEEHYKEMSLGDLKDKIEQSKERTATLEQDNSSWEDVVNKKYNDINS